MHPKYRSAPQSLEVGILRALPQSRRKQSGQIETDFIIFSKNAARRMHDTEIEYFRAQMNSTTVSHNELTMNRKRTTRPQTTRPIGRTSQRRTTCTPFILAASLLHALLSHLCFPRRPLIQAQYGTLMRRQANLGGGGWVCTCYNECNTHVDAWMP